MAFSRYTCVLRIFYKVHVTRREWVCALFGRWTLLKSLGCSRSLQKKACSVHRGNADSILRRDENTSSSDAGLWPDVGRDFFIKATSRQAVCPVQCRITVLELGGSSPPNAALQEADESQLQAVPCGKRLPSAGVPTAFLLQGASDCCKGSFLFGRTTDFFSLQLWKKWF